jgi:hypothetical protein
MITAINRRDVVFNFYFVAPARTKARKEALNKKQSMPGRLLVNGYWGVWTLNVRCQRHELPRKGAVGFIDWLGLTA